MGVMVATVLAISLTGTIASVDTAAKVQELLRQAAIEAGCPKEHVRLVMRWRGAGQPVEIEIRCEDHGR